MNKYMSTLIRCSQNICADFVRDVALFEEIKLALDKGWYAILH